MSKTDAHDSTAFEYLHCDVLGSVRVITDDDGTKIGATTYSPYGTVTEHTGTATSALGYTGNLTDRNTGLIYLRARDYQPSTGQFLTVDPAVDATHQPYAYVDGNPISRTDPSGLCWDGFGLVCDAGSKVGDFVNDNFQKGTAGGHVLSAANGVLDTVTFGGSTWAQEVISPGSSCAYARDGYFKAGQIAGYLIPVVGPSFAATRLAIGAARLGIRTGLKSITRAVSKTLLRQGERRATTRIAAGEAQSSGGVLATIGDFRSKQAAFSHYAKHVKGVKLGPRGQARAVEPDMPEYRSFEEYRSAARSFMGGGTPEGAIEATRGSDLMRLNPTSGMFGVRGADGVIRTFFRPRGGGTEEWMSYFRQQLLP